jgi:DNA-binding SARP family transcriptional activator
MEKTMHLALHVLGGFHATIDQTPIPKSRAKRIEALLIFLAVEARRSHRREVLTGLLFPDAPKMRPAPTCARR